MNVVSHNWLILNQGSQLWRLSFTNRSPASTWSIHKCIFVGYGTVNHREYLILEKKSGHLIFLWRHWFALSGNIPVLPQFPHHLISWPATPRALFASNLNTLRYFLPTCSGMSKIVSPCYFIIIATRGKQLASHWHCHSLYHVCVGLHCHCHWWCM